MFERIPRTLQAQYMRISQGEPDGDRVYCATVQATKDNMRYICARKTCDLLVKTRRAGIALNEVEHSVNRTCAMLSDQQRFVVKMKIMRSKLQMHTEK